MSVRQLYSLQITRTGGIISRFRKSSNSAPSLKQKPQKQYYIWTKFITEWRNSAFVFLTLWVKEYIKLPIVGFITDMQVFINLRRIFDAKMLIWMFYNNHFIRIKFIFAGFREQRWQTVGLSYRRDWKWRYITKFILLITIFSTYLKFFIDLFGHVLIRSDHCPIWLR